MKEHEGSLMVTNAAPRPSSAASIHPSTPTTAPTTIRQRLSSAWDQILGNTGHPLEAEYNPLQAGIVGAGAATDSGINQLKRAFQTGAARFAGLSDDPAMQAEAERMRALAGQTNTQIQDANAIYQPMKEAFPYATAIGEAAPAGIPGGLPAMYGQAAWNVGKESLSDLSKVLNSVRLAELARALKNY